MNPVSSEQAEQFYQFLKENLTIQAKSRTLGFPEENDSYDEHQVVLLLKNPQTEEWEEISVAKISTVTY